MIPCSFHVNILLTTYVGKTRFTIIKVGEGEAEHEYVCAKGSGRVSTDGYNVARGVDPEATRLKLSNLGEALPNLDAIAKGVKQGEYSWSHSSQRETRRQGVSTTCLNL